MLVNPVTGPKFSSGRFDSAVAVLNRAPEVAQQVTANLNDGLPEMLLKMPTESVSGLGRGHAWMSGK